MVEFRVIGNQEQIDRAIAIIREHFSIISVSSTYSVRNSELLRCYIKAEQKGGNSDGNN